MIIKRQKFPFLSVNISSKARACVEEKHHQIMIIDVILIYMREIAVKLFFFVYKARM